MYTIHDTIVAPATPPGEGALGIIRLSGTDAVDIVAGIFFGKPLKEQKTHTAHFGKIKDGDRIIDEVVVTLFCAPHSYTGENIVEISCHGSQYILQQVTALCLSRGARMAKPGEFTLRAFLKGKMDLAQAEAVADLIASHSGAAHRAAIHNLRGGFSARLKVMREELIKFSALIELELDFSEEDVTFADRPQLYSLVADLTQTTTALLQSFKLGNIVKNGVSVAIIGKPNTGKSTLLNTLLDEERAIVSDIAGTTRDTIEETLNIDGILFRLIDTAGIRDHSVDVIENIGMERSKTAMEQADIVVYLFDVLNSDPQQVAQQKATFEANSMQYIMAGNKVDAAGLLQAKQKFGDDVVYISAKNKDNIHQLKDLLYQKVIAGGVNPEDTLVTNARHYGALQDVLASLQDVKVGMDNNLPGDLVTLDIRRTLHYLGDITGEVTTEDKLDYIFSKFCIGK